MGLRLEPGSDMSDYAGLEDSQGRLWTEVLAQEPRTAEQMYAPTHLEHRPIHSYLDVLMAHEEDVVVAAASIVVASQLETITSNSVGGTQ